MPNERVVLKRNLDLQKKFFEYIESPDKELRKKLLILVNKYHNHQWTNGPIYNILTSGSNCRNDCKYCYMKRIKSKFFGVDIEDLNMVIDDKKVYKNWRKVDKKHCKIIMFPSSHDIFEEYLDEFIITCKNILNAGHRLLIVTKPRRKCIEEMIVEFNEFKKDILFRLTITSDDEKIVKYYEPNAPSIEERIGCLKLLFENNYRTSVSMEPFLSDPMKLIEIIDKYISDDIWIGTMSGINSNNEIDDKHKDELYKLYNKENLVDIINKLKDNKKIFWKTSIMKIVIRK